MTQIGLPSGVRACLFDLDGVLTRTAVVHAAAWKEMFDDFLRDRDGDGLPAVRRRRRLRRVRRRPAARRRGAHLPRLPRTSSCPRASPDDPPRRRDRARPGQPQERPGPGEDPHRRRRGVRRLGALRGGGAGARACAPRWSPPAPTAATCWSPRASSTSSTSGSTAWSPPSAGCPASRKPGHLPGGRPRTWASTPAQAARLRGRPGRHGRRPRGPVRLRRRRRPGRAGRRAAPARRRHRGQGPRRADREDARDHRPGLRRRALVAARDRARTSTCCRRASRCSRCPTATSAGAATSTRASRTACPAPTSTASTNCTRCRTPRPATATRSPARPSSTSPTAR